MSQTDKIDGVGDLLRAATSIKDIDAEIAARERELKVLRAVRAATVVKEPRKRRRKKADDAGNGAELVGAGKEGGE